MQRKKRFTWCQTPIGATHASPLHKPIESIGNISYDAPMSFHADLSLDVNYMLTEPLGSDAGLTAEAIESVFPAARQVQKALDDLHRLGQLPFQDLPSHEEDAELMLSKGRTISQNFEEIVVLGIGGSALGPACLYDFLTPPFNRLRPPQERMRPRLFVVDNVDGREWHQLSEVINLDKTFFVVISKSGRTVETLAAFAYFREKLIERRGETAYRQNFAIITDPEEGPLRAIAEHENILTFEIPPGVGGRYSVLSPVGLFPAACVGIDIREVLRGARDMHERSHESDFWINPAFLSGIIHYLVTSQKNKTNRVFMPYSEALESCTEWYAQLWAESLGKQHTIDGKQIYAGSTPIRAMGATDQHSQLQLYLEGPRDKVVTFFTTSDTAPVALPMTYPQHPDFLGLHSREVGELLNIEYRATEQALRRKGIPSMTVQLPHLNESTLGQLFYFAEMETVVTGELYNINPFNQPAVESIKKYIKALLGFDGFEKERTEIEATGKDKRYII